MILKPTAGLRLLALTLLSASKTRLLGRNLWRRLQVKVVRQLSLHIALALRAPESSALSNEWSKAPLNAPQHVHDISELLFEPLG